MKNNGTRLKIRFLLKESFRDKSNQEMLNTTVCWLNTGIPWWDLSELFVLINFCLCACVICIHF